MAGAETAQAVGEATQMSTRPHMKIKSKIYAVYQCGDRWLYHSRDDAQRECDRLNDETDGEIGDGAATVMEIDVSDDD